MGRAWSAKGGRSGWWRRLSFDLPSPTLVTMPNHASTALCHPTEVRALTLREYARIQEFPDEWEFRGTPAEQYVQVGNAVPVRLGRVAGTVLARELDALREQAWQPYARRSPAYRITSHVESRPIQGAGDNKARGHTENMGPDVRCPRLHSDRRAESARHAAGVYQRAQTARNVVPRRRCPFSDVGASRRPRPQAQGRSIPPLSRAEDHDRSEGASNEQRQGNNGRVLRHVPMRRQRPPILSLCRPAMSSTQPVYSSGSSTWLPLDYSSSATNGDSPSRETETYHVLLNATSRQSSGSTSSRVASLSLGRFKHPLSQSLSSCSTRSSASDLLEHNEIRVVLPRVNLL